MELVLPFTFITLIVYLQGRKQRTEKKIKIISNNTHKTNICNNCRAMLPNLGCILESPWEKVQLFVFFKGPQVIQGLPCWHR